MRVSAPGKVLLFGEYAVLQGAPAVVMAVDRRAVLRPAGGSFEGTGLDLVAQGRLHTWGRRHRPGVPSAWIADSSAFSDARGKLGLGSSAAVAVGAVASVFAEEGVDLADERVRRDVLRWAREVHDRFQGRPGSGVDVAAAVFGGLRVWRADRESAEPWALPSGIRCLFARSGRSSSTVDRLAALGRLLEGPDRKEGTRILEEMGGLAEEMVHTEEAGRFLEEVARYGALMERLGVRMGRPMLVPEEEALRRDLEAWGGSLKPSGAGGGDLLLICLPEEVSAEEVARAVQLRGMSLVDLRREDGGVRREEDAP